MICTLIDRSLWHQFALPCVQILLGLCGMFIITLMSTLCGLDFFKVHTYHKILFQYFILATKNTNDMEINLISIDLGHWLQFCYTYLSLLLVF